MGYGPDMAPQNRVGLAFLDSLRQLLAQACKVDDPMPPRLVRALDEIQRCPPNEVFDLLGGAVGDVEKAIVGVWANASHSDFVRRTFRAGMDNPTAEEVDLGSQILSRWIGGDTETYKKTWFDVPLQ